MPSWPRRMLWSSLAALFVLIAAFWITLQLTEDPDLWSAHSDPHNSAIQVSEATYGLTCLAFKPRPGLVNAVKTGNATSIISEVCDKAMETCEFFADLGQMPDPAPGCDKDLSVNWRCGGADKLKFARVTARADGKFVSLRCP